MVCGEVRRLTMLRSGRLLTRTNFRRLSTRSAAAQPLAEEALRLAREASIVGFETAKDHNDCGICLDTEEEVAIDGCDHMLCGGCCART